MANDFSEDTTSLVEHINDWVSTRIPGESFVFHEIASLDIHLDVYVWPPTPERPVWTLVTSGMSDRAMKMPEHLAEYSRAELMLTLPGDWPIDQIKTLGEETKYSWPILVLKNLARLPFAIDGYLSWGTTTQANRELTDTYPFSDFNGVLISHPLVADPEEFYQLTVGNDSVVFWGVYFIYTDELAYSFEHGGGALADLLDEANIHHSLIPRRASVLESRKH